MFARLSPNVLNNKIPNKTSDEEVDWAQTTESHLDRLQWAKTRI